MLRRTLSSLLLLAATAGCTADDPRLGGALRHDYALQVIDPDPKPKSDMQPGADGIRTAAAIDRYEKGTVIEPEPIKTTSTISPTK